MSGHVASSSARRPRAVVVSRLLALPARPASDCGDATVLHRTSPRSVILELALSPSSSQRRAVSKATMPPYEWPTRMLDSSPQSASRTSAAAAPTELWARTGGDRSTGGHGPLQLSARAAAGWNCEKPPCRPGRYASRGARRVDRCGRSSGCCCCSGGPGGLNSTMNWRKSPSARFSRPWKWVERLPSSRQSSQKTVRGGADVAGHRGRRSSPSGALPSAPHSRRRVVAGRRLRKKYGYTCWCAWQRSPPASSKRHARTRSFSRSTSFAMSVVTVHGRGRSASDAESGM
mmetsp:Transcript_2000/g.7725  ORF Transcript_2000/g.7725 Transcript_2000/m.7725 type:complete len:289 (-) Transcript_2000:696-1562(-)